MGTTAAGFTGIPRPSKGKSFRAQGTTASDQFHGLLPKAALPVSSAGLDVTKTATPQQPTLRLFALSKEMPSCSQKVNMAWNAENPSKACLGWHPSERVQHLQFSDSWLLLEAAMICYLQHEL